MTLPSTDSVPIVEARTATTATRTPSPTSATTNNCRHPFPGQALSSNQHHITATPPSFPSYGYIDPNIVYEVQRNGHHSNDNQQQPHLQQHQQQQSQQAYVIYPVSPQFYYSEYQNYTGSPALIRQSSPMNPNSPPFSPTYQYQNSNDNSNNNGVGPSTNGKNRALPTTSHTAYVIPTHHPVHPSGPNPPHFPPLHLSSPVLTGTPVGSPPYPMVGLPEPSIHQHQQYFHHQQQQRQQHMQHRYNGKKKNQQSHHHHQNISLGEHSYNQQATPEELSLNHHPQNVYVRGLSSSTTDESFLELCKAYGSVKSSKAILDQKTGECKGYGFALFEQEQECRTAMDGLNQAGLQASLARLGQESFSSRLRNLQDETSTNIYISNLPLDVTEQKLEELFQPFKTISSRILYDPKNGMSRGVGFARMIDRTAADAIIERFNGHTMIGSSASLQVRYADSIAQKKLKNQTSRKRVVRPPEFQSMVAGFSSMHMMPITPETMLGIAPSMNQQPHQPLSMAPPTISMDQGSPGNMNMTVGNKADVIE